MLIKDTNKKKKTILFFCDSQVQKEGVIENSEYNYQMMKCPASGMKQDDTR